MTAPKGISETQVREILARLIPVYHPMEVYLFGSRAWGTPQADSDVDLLVVVESAAVDKAERLRLGTRALLGMGIDIDLLVFTAAEVHAKGAHPSTIIHKVLTQGIRLYEAA